VSEALVTPEIENLNLDMFAVQLKPWMIHRACVSVNDRIQFAVGDARNSRKRSSVRLQSRKGGLDCVTSDREILPQISSGRNLTGLIEDLSQKQDFWLPLVSLLGFAGVAILVFEWGPDSPLLKLDTAVHDWVVSNIPNTVSNIFFGKVLSNLFLEFDLIVGTSLLLVHWMGNRNQGPVLSGLGSLFFLLGVGSHKYDGLLVYALKQYFHRRRPHPFLSYSFPSGHVTSAVFLTGALLYVILPVTLQNLDEKTDASVFEQIKKLDGSLNKSAFWGLSFVCTAMGRVGGNVHWLSDTIAACLLGIALTSVFTSLHRFLTQRTNEISN